MEKVTSESNGYGIFFGYYSYNNITKDSDFSGNTERDVESSHGIGGSTQGLEYTTNVFQDCTYETEGGSLTCKVTYQAMVVENNDDPNEQKPINDALVTAVRRQIEEKPEEIAFAVRTNPDGTIAIPVTSYILENGARTAEYFPLEITAEKTGFEPKTEIWTPDPNNPIHRIALEKDNTQ